MKQLLSSLAIATSIATASAGGYLTNTNQHVAFLRNPARGASVEIDALYSNPAGTAFLPNGWHLSLNLQSAYQTRSIATTYAPLALNADGKSLQGTRTFEATASAPVIPSLMVAYKTGRWTLGGHLAIGGGGGKANFGTGLPSFEAPIAAVTAGVSQVLQAQGLGTAQYSLSSAMQGRQYILGATLGAAYRLSDNLSVYLGGRVNYMTSHYEGYLKDIRMTFAGRTLPMADALNALASGNVPPATAAMLRRYATMMGDRALEVNQTGWGITPIIGIHFQADGVNLAAKYEHRTSLRYKNATKVNTTGIASYDDGLEMNSDIPSLLTLGGSYAPIKALRLSAGYHVYFDKAARMPGDRQHTLKRSTFEYLAGIEYDLTSRLTISAGGQITDYGLSDAFQQDLSFSCDSFSIGLGGSYRLSKALKLNVAYFTTRYTDYTKSVANYVALATPAIPGKDVFSRTNHVFGLGLDLTL